MLSQLGKFGVSLAVAALGMASLIGDASAANINTHGTAFQPLSLNAKDGLGYTGAGVFSLIHENLEVIGPVLRSPTNSSSQSFYIDGTNGPGASTSFVLYAYDYQGHLQSSVSFQASAPIASGASYDLYQTLSPIDNYSYVSLYALIPANNRGTFGGVTAIQP
jgi:hypothetical protein